MKVKEFLAMDNIAGKTIAIIMSGTSYNVKIPVNVTEPFKTDGGIFLGFTHDIFNAECKILETTVADFFNRNHPHITYTHKIDKCGWNKYHICLGFEIVIFALTPRMRKNSNKNFIMQLTRNSIWI